MTDQQTYTDDTAQTDLTIKCMQDATVITVGSIEADDDRLVMLPTLALLAMIDRAAPDMMRAYLRETVPEADSPEDVDEHAVIELSDDIDTRLHIIERLAKILRAGTDAVEVCTLADWVMDR